MCSYNLAAHRVHSHSPLLPSLPSQCSGLSLRVAGLLLLPPSPSKLWQEPQGPHSHLRPQAPSAALPPRHLVALVGTGSHPHSSRILCLIAPATLTVMPETSVPPPPPSLPPLGFIQSPSAVPPFWCWNSCHLSGGCPCTAATPFSRHRVRPPSLQPAAQLGHVYHRPKGRESVLSAMSATQKGHGKFLKFGMEERLSCVA